VISKPAVVPYKYNLDGDLETYRQLATSAKEVCSVMITSTGTSTFARVYDTDSSTRKDVKKCIPIAANAGESVTFTPAQPILFEKGIYLEFEQGAWAGGELFVTYQ
jgi:hypothetical protein